MALVLQSVFDLTHFMKYVRSKQTATKEPLMEVPIMTIHDGLILPMNHKNFQVADYSGVP